MPSRIVLLAYGKTGLDVGIHADPCTVVEPRYAPGATEPVSKVTRALRSLVAGPPRLERLRQGQSVATPVRDRTRAQRRRVIILALLAELHRVLDLNEIVILFATGTYRANTDAELREMLTDDLVDSVRIVNQDGRDESTLIWRGMQGNRVPGWPAREWSVADVRIATAYVEPHFFAGFSGGPKTVAPALAGLHTVLTLRDARRIGHPKARWRITQGNPIHDDIRAIAANTGVTLSLDVALNRDNGIIEAFGGDAIPAQAAAVSLARQLAVRAARASFDVVITTNLGRPPDHNLYQAANGMSAAYQVTRTGGTICGAECRDGFPGQGEIKFRQNSPRQNSPNCFGNRPGNCTRMWDIRHCRGWHS